MDATARSDKRKVNMNSDFEWKRTDECLPPCGQRIIANLHIVARNGESSDFCLFMRYMGEKKFVLLLVPNAWEIQDINESRCRSVTHWARIPEIPESERDRLWKEDEKWR